MIEVVLGLRRRLDEPEIDPVAEVEERAAVLSLDDHVVGQLVHRRVQVVHTKRDVLEGTALTRSFSLEQRQLPLARIGADQREGVGPLDDVHAEVRRDEVGDAVPVGEPVRDVIEGLRAHGAGKIAPRLRAAEGDYFLRSTARWSWALFIFERPSMPMRLASL